MFLPLAVFTSLYFLLNTWLIALAVAVHRRQSAWNIWWPQFTWVSVNYFGGASLAILIVTYGNHIDVGTLLAIIPLVLVCSVGFIGGAELPGGPLGLLTLAIAALGIAFTASGFGLGLAFRMQSLAAATLTQFVIFFTIFLSTAQMPLHFIKGWVKPIARVNPMTNVLRLAREGFLGKVTWHGSWGGLLAIGVLAVLTTVYAARGLRSFDK